MSIECRYIQCPRSSGAQCIYTTIGLIYSNYAIVTKYLRMHTPQLIDLNHVFAGLKTGKRDSAFSPRGATCL